MSIKPNTTPRATRVIALGLLCGFSVSAFAQWVPRLEDSKDGYRKPDSEFSIPVPSNLSNEFLSQLALELDGVDVTALIQMVKGRAIFKPAEPVNYGKHILRIVQLTADGEINELAYWEFEVRQTSAFREAHFNADVDLMHTRRLEPQQVEGQNQNQNMTEGFVGINSSLAEGNWQGDLRMNTLANSDSSRFGNEQHYDLADFLISSKTTNTTTLLGHQTVNHASMVMNQFGSRGGSIQYNSDDQRYNATAFSMYRNPVHGFEKGMGVATEQPSIDGMHVTAYPSKEDPGKYYVSMVYLQGKDATQQPSGAGYSIEAAPQDGRAWAMQAEARLLDKQLRLGTEYASTMVSAKATSMTIDDYAYTTEAYSRSDNAYAMYAVWNSAQNTGAEIPTNWKLGLEHRVVGAQFQSIANPNLPFDRDSWKVFSELNRGGFAVQLSVGTEHDNIEESIELPTIQKDIYAINSSWSPALNYDDKGQPIVGLLGQQSYAVNYSKETRRQIKDGVDSFALPVREEMDTAGVTGNFAYPSWGWNVGYNTSYYRDLTDQNSDNIVQGSTLGVNFPLGSKVTLTHTLHKQVTYICDTGLQRNEANAALQLNIQFIPAKLTTAVNYSLNDATMSDDSVDSKTESMTTNLTWIMREARENRPGMRLQLSGSRNRTTDRILNEVYDSSQVFLSFAIGIPVRY